MPWLVVASVVVPACVSVMRVLTSVWSVGGPRIDVVCTRLVIRDPVGMVPVVPVRTPVSGLAGDVHEVPGTSMEGPEEPKVL